MASIPATPEGCKPLWAAADRAEHRWRKIRNQGIYRDTAAFAEANLFRQIVEQSALYPGARKVLGKLVNLSIRHQGQPLAISIPDLAREIKAKALNTVRTHLRTLIEKGIVVVLSKGHGRGNVSSYAVDFDVMRNELAPDLIIATGTERITADGEILSNVKGSTHAHGYHRISTTPFPSPFCPLPRRRLRWFRVLSGKPDRLLSGLMERLARTLKGKRPPGWPKTAQRSDDMRISLSEALNPFAMVGELIDLETEGFSDTDTLCLVTEDGHLLDRFEVGDFRRASAAAKANWE